MVRELGRHTAQKDLPHRAIQAVADHDEAGILVVGDTQNLGRWMPAHGHDPMGNTRGPQQATIQRRHTTLGNLSPADYESAHAALCSA